MTEPAGPSQPPSKRVVAVCGSSAPRPGDALYETAYRIGRGLAEAGLDVINGGHDGTMEASARGARDGGERVLGVTCQEIRASRGVTTNAYLDEIIEAPTLLSRIERIMRHAGGYCFLEGGTGTLAEFGMIWEHVHRGLIAPRPLVCVGNFWRATVRAVATAQPGAEATIHFADGAEPAVKTLAAKAIPLDERDRAFLP